MRSNREKNKKEWKKKPKNLEKKKWKNSGESIYWMKNLANNNLFNSLKKQLLLEDLKEKNEKEVGVVKGKKEKEKND